MTVTYEGKAAVVRDKAQPLAIELWRAGRFPFDRFVSFYDLADIDQVIADPESGRVLKPIVRPATGDRA